MQLQDKYFTYYQSFQTDQITVKLNKNLKTYYFNAAVYILSNVVDFLNLHGLKKK